MYRSCLGKQLQEIEILRSIYCNDGELSIQDEEQFEAIKSDYENSCLGSARSSVGFHLSVRVPAQALNKKMTSLCIQIRIPQFYPSTEPVSVQFPDLYKIFAKQQEKDFRKQFSVFSENKLGGECIMDLVEWVRHRVDPVNEESLSFTELSSSPPRGATQSPSIPQAQTYDFRRVLLWFSTIAPDRAKIVADWAKQLGLTGLSRLGSPALLLVEGPREDVDEFVSSLRTYRWKKMDIVWEDRSRVCDIKTERKFAQFIETMNSVSELQPIFRKAGLEAMFKEGLKIRG